MLFYCKVTLKFDKITVFDGTKLNCTKSMLWITEKHTKKLLVKTFHLKL